MFEKRFTRFTCCNLFKTLKRNVKGGHKISLQLATKLLGHRYNCIPDWQLCRTCYDIAQEIEKNLAMKCCNLSMNHHKLISWILRQPIIQLTILIQMKQENNQEKIEQRSSVYRRYTQSVLCKRKAMIHVSEEMKTKASGLDRLTEQIRGKNRQWEVLHLKRRQKSLLSRLNLGQ